MSLYELGLRVPLIICVSGLAADPAHGQERDRLYAALRRWLIDTDDPATGVGEFGYGECGVVRTIWGGECVRLRLAGRTTDAPMWKRRSRGRIWTRRSLPAS